MKNTTSIGGYMGLELTKNKAYHNEVICLNTARNALEVLLSSNEYEKIYMPLYTCDVLLQPINRLKIAYDFYSIDKDFYPKFDFSTLKKRECFLYTNYFGLCGRISKKLSKLCPNLVIDNAQAFFEKPLKGIDTFYSPRKFLGVPDGGYAYPRKKLMIDYPQDTSFDRFQHLLKRLDVSPEFGYTDFIKNEEVLNNQPPKQMSRVTKMILDSVNYKSIASKRKANFKFLHNTLKDHNLLKFKFERNYVPLAYPFFSNNESLREILLHNKVYIPQYWLNVLDWVHPNQIEYSYSKYILPLPIDQHINIIQLKRIVDLIKKHR